MSQRILIVGVSASGKTTLANKLIADITLPVFIRDPMRSEWLKNDGFFETEHALKNLLKNTPRSVVIIDEASDFFGLGQKDNHWIFTRGRHFGILPIAIAQRVRMLSPNVREQATDVYIFESSKEAAEIMAEAHNSSQILDCVDFSQGEFLHVRRVNGTRKITHHNLF